MHIHPLDAYHFGDSLLHRADARVKLSLVLLFILCVSLMPIGAWPAYVLLFAFVLSASVASELGLTFALKRSLLALPFLLTALPLLVTVKGAVIVRVSLGSWVFSLTASGLERFLSIALKSWLAVQMAVLLTATTPLPDILVAMRALGVPRLLIAILGLMWRYLFVLADEALRMIRAREARSASASGKGGGTVTWRARVAGGMVGSLFLRGYERSERIYHAMLARGYDGTIRSLPLRPLSSVERVILGVGAALLLALLFVGHLLG
ncbi:MAG: cobalt ECF transporter T component CbiQ [Anaerolineae bacterium]